MTKKVIKVLDKTSKISGAAAAIGVSATMLSGSDNDHSKEEIVNHDKPVDDHQTNEELVTETPQITEEAPVSESPILQNTEQISHNHTSHRSSSHTHHRHHHVSQTAIPTSAELTEADQVDDSVIIEPIDSTEDLYADEVGTEPVDQMAEETDEMVITEIEEDEDWMSENFAETDDSDLIALNDADTELGADYVEKADGDMFAPEDFSDTDIPDVVHDSTNAIDFL